jgi:multicomponent K+:H+ antiporter subunit E
VRSNILVARIILRDSPGRRPGFVRIPLEMRSPYGLAALACIITATPGTVWADYDSESSMLTIHVLNLVEEKIWIDTIKGRYERRLREILE